VATISHFWALSQIFGHTVAVPTTKWYYTFAKQQLYYTFLVIKSTTQTQHNYSAFLVNTTTVQTHHNYYAFLVINTTQHILIDTTHFW